MVLTGRMAVGTFLPGADVARMSEFDIVEGNPSFFYPHMAEGGAGHLCLKLLRLVILIDHRHGLLGFIPGHIEKLDGILDIVNTSAKKNKAVIVPGLVDQVLRPSVSGAPSCGLLEIIKRPSAHWRSRWFVSISALERRAFQCLRV